jgi:error-prone DNA polymerase
MPSDPFVHLHVASGYSLRYGASHPDVLVERAAEHGMDTLALTDRDGTYGVVKFVQAAQSAGLRPILGVDLAIEPSGKLSGAHPSLRMRGARNGASNGTGGRLDGRADDRSSAHSPGASTRSTPARGGASVDPRHPRVTLLAQDRAGWAALCRLVSATHLRGERGSPVTTLDLIAEHVQAAAVSGGGLLVLLGPTSELGRALTVRRPDLAREVLAQWRDAVPAREDLLVEVVSHRGPDDVPRAARMLGFATDEGVPAVLSNAVRYADRLDAPTADVLDASRRLVALDARHVDRVNAEGCLKSGKEMHEVADEVTRAAGRGQGAATDLMAATRRVADRCAVDPRADLGMGEVHFPELEVLDGTGNLATDRTAKAVLRERCEAGLGRRAMPATSAVRERLESELGIIEALGYPAYFLTVADVVDLIRGMGVRVAARGSGAGCLVNYLLGISGVDPMAHGLLMERFLSPLRIALPDVDIDVESARRTEVYEQILDRFGGERVACVSMMDTYRVRHAIRDVGAALGMPPGEIDAIAKAFPHIRARDVRLALAELPELRASHLAEAQLDLLFRLVERLDGLPRHIALHPCGVLLSDTTLLDRTPVEASWLGFPMSQFDKDDVEALGLLKLDVLGIRMQSAMAHAIVEVARVDGAAAPVDLIDLDDQSQVPLDDPDTFALIRSTRTLGMFQIESPGQRELVGKFGPETFGDLITDISLFRPGPVKSDMVTPFLQARQGWREAVYLHDDLRPALEETCGVVVFHEQVLQIVSVFTGVSLAEADEVRRALGSPESQADVKLWFRPLALARGYEVALVDKVWEVLKAFASFGFCKAHAAAFALPTFQSAWLKAHHPAAFLAGVLTHDPGMYPKRLILDDARQFGIAVLSLDVNVSTDAYRLEKVTEDTGDIDTTSDDTTSDDTTAADYTDRADMSFGRGIGYGIRLSLADVKGISAAEVARIVAARPYASLADFWHRAAVSRPIVERLVLTGAFDALYCVGEHAVSPALSPGIRRRGRLTRRDLLLQVAELDRWTRAVARGGGRGGGRSGGRARTRGRSRTDLIDLTVAAAPGEALTMVERPDVRTLAARQSQAARPVEARPVQLALDLGDAPADVLPSGLPEMTGAERVRAELEVLGLDASRHVIDFYEPFLAAIGATRAPDLVRCRSSAEVLVAGVKVATQTPPIRSGRRVVFVTLDDARGPVDATFFEDAQGPYAATLFHSWLLVIRGEVRRTGPRGVSLRATGCWVLTDLFTAWQTGGLAAVAEAMSTPGEVTEAAIAGAAESHSSRPVMTRPPGAEGAGSTAGGMGNKPGSRRVLVHASGFRQSPYADIKPPGDDAATAARKAAREPKPPRKLWHTSPGSPG